MKKRLHNKTAGIALLTALIVITLAEVIFRAIALKDFAFTTSNFGEQLAVIAFAVTILILTAKGMDRACYICYGAWAAYFVFDQLFELPGVISQSIHQIGNSQNLFHIGNAAVIIRILSMCGIIAIGILLIEYMNDGTIYNRAFNSVCFVTVLLILSNIVISFVVGLIAGLPVLFLETFNAMYRIAMVFLFTFFAYDSAKHQLKKVDFTK